MLNLYHLEQDFLRRMADAQVPGAALAIVHQGELCYARGFGVTSVEAGAIPVTPETRFRIGSLTKSMTATAIMQLVAQGQLSLDAPLTKYLPDLRFDSPVHSAQITLRMLLSHSAGLPSSYSMFGSRDPDGLRQHIEQDISQLAMLAPPGLLYSYSNPGFRLAGYVMEAVSGRPYTTLMQQLLFDPLAMAQTTFDPTVAMTYPLAQSHDLSPEGVLSVQHRYADNSGGYPSGGAISTLSDLAQYAIAHLQQRLPGMAEMQQAQVQRYTLQQGHYGLGWMLDEGRGYPQVWHEGLISTFGTRLLLLPETQSAIIILCNRAFAFWGEMDAIIEQISAALLEPSPWLLPMAPATPENWPDCCGHYLGQERGAALITVRGEGLLLTWNGRDLPLHPLGKDLYYAYKLDSDEAIAVGFVRDAAGSPYLMLKSAPCAPVAPFELLQTSAEQLAAYEGQYQGADKLRVWVEGGRLWVFSEEYNLPSPCVALGPDRFACDFGLLEFGSQPALTLAKVYPLERVS